MITQPPLQALILAMELTGNHVLKTSDGGFDVIKFGQVKHCPDYAALLAFARLVGVHV